MNTITTYLTTDSNEVLTLFLTEEKATFLKWLYRNNLLREDIEIKANTTEIVVFDDR